MSTTELNETRNMFLKSLREKVCNVKFTKVNGEERDMHCTLNMDIIPENHRPKDNGANTQTSFDVIRAFDVDADGWRSFRIENVQTFVAI